MSTQSIAVTILGSGPVAELLAQRIGQRKDLNLVATLPSSEQPPADTACVVYLPTSADLAAGAAAERINTLLRAGINVVSTAPVEALPTTDLLAACRDGGSTFHGSGGFQSRLITRFNRAFASITRDLQNVVLIEELDIEDAPAHPWTAPSDAGFDNSDPQKLSPNADDIEGYYRAGLHTLSDAVFGNPQLNETVTHTATRVQHIQDATRGRTEMRENTNQVIVRRELGPQIAYDSIWTQRQGSETPLRYRFSTTSADATGHATITFHAETDVRPVDHLTCAGLMDAIRAAQESAPGILHHDLEINHVKSDDRLTH